MKNNIYRAYILEESESFNQKIGTALDRARTKRIRAKLFFGAIFFVSIGAVI